MQYTIDEAIKDYGLKKTGVKYGELEEYEIGKEWWEYDEEDVEPDPSQDEDI